MANSRGSGRAGLSVRGVLWGSAGVLFAGYCGLYLVSYVTTGGHPFQPVTTSAPTHATTTPATQARQPDVNPNCHVTLNVRSVNATLKKAQKCRRLRLENGVVVTVRHQ
jgi:hypothetical protein